ncbi:arginine--tRNA ligase [Balneolaceae bacterium]|jgi:arginyl-tRNA synthetase|nr:arginine--tRNA ligase [Balneolaceae bacterium]MBL6916319.1 arginine--tRNA ligase [Balneolaceae bacterium]MDC0591713.1 arginine--tRNA ligase [Balneolaceae bacterium]MDC3296670.1 arginine--tRNA ligase [Balneolaceae bacterium]CAI8403140.1 MAG: Arginine--tRNA ligase [Rhodothermaeota bacterium MED-G12]|tara:strand:- start:1068 stop:2705 length:1638 start_codon:yes stop_codon:yes gene_type:complete
MNSYIYDLLQKALSGLDISELPEIQLESPKVAEHGDVSTNIAMLLAKPLRQNPRAIAQQLLDAMPLDPQVLEAIEIAGPGFINFRFAKEYVYQQLRAIIEEGSDFGKTASRKGQRIQIEFVSANPTGPLTVGHGRNAVLGDTIARLLEWTGASVDREYYFNDAGRQMRVLGQSVHARYQQLLGQSIELPEGGYEGAYIIDIAQGIVDQYGKEWEGKDWEAFKKVAQEAIFTDISQTLERMNIHMDSFFNEFDLYENGDIEKVLAALKEKGLVYEADGATWFKTTEFGKEKDTVLVKSTGEPTYRLPDIAYHANKLDRGYDECVDVFGADHIATYPDVLSALQALGYDEQRIRVIVYQFVTLVKDGQPFKMSTRKANFVTLDELMDEVGSDVTRFFFLMRSPNTHLEFDIGQAKEAGEKNPVFYLQYAHARIHSILRKAEEEYGAPPESPTLEQLKPLVHPSELTLMKTLFKLPKAIAGAADANEPHRLINYLNDVATDFTSFYHDCRIMGVEQECAQARVLLARQTARVLSNGLGILGIHAPEQM